MIFFKEKHMKLKMKLMAAAVALVASAGANAAIDNGAGGNGELFFSIWDANGSYTRSLETSIDSFQSQLAATGNLALSWAADTTFTSFLAGVASPAALKWNVVALDGVGARRLLTTYTLPETNPIMTADVVRSAVLNGQGFVNAVNTALGNTTTVVSPLDSVAVGSSSAAWAGKPTFKDNFDLFNFSNAGTLARNSYANGLGFMRIDAGGTGTNLSGYNEYLEGTTAVNAWLDQSGTLNIGAVATVAAIPEPSEYALMLAGLGMLGFMARRRLNNRA